MQRLKYHFSGIDSYRWFGTGSTQQSLQNRRVKCTNFATYSIKQRCHRILKRTWRLLRTSCSSFCTCCCCCPSTATLLFDCKPITCLLSKVYCQLLPNAETVTDYLVDGVNLYARELLTLALLWHKFNDACKGDGDRILLCWKMMLPMKKGLVECNTIFPQFLPALE